MEIWDQNRFTVNLRPSETSEPDQYTYIGTNGTATLSAQGRYNISDFTSSYSTAQAYTDSSSPPQYTGQPKIAKSTMVPLDAPFAGSIPTAQFIATDCGSTSALVYYKIDDVVQQENVNADPTA